MNETRRPQPDRCTLHDSSGITGDSLRIDSGTRPESVIPGDGVVSGGAPIEAGRVVCAKGRHLFPNNSVICECGIIDRRKKMMR